MKPTGPGFHMHEKKSWPHGVFWGRTGKNVIFEFFGFCQNVDKF